MRGEGKKKWDWDLEQDSVNVALTINWRVNILLNSYGMCAWKVVAQVRSAPCGCCLWSSLLGSVPQTFDKWNFCRLYVWIRNAYCFHLAFVQFLGGLIERQTFSRKKALWSGKSTFWENALERKKENTTKTTHNQPLVSTEIKMLQKKSAFQKAHTFFMGWA